MAHQAHKIPWNTLASTLQVKFSNRCQHDANNFHTRRQLGRGKKWTFFANAFVRNALDHARCEREKFPKSFAPPEEEEEVLGNEICNKINATVYRWRLDYTRCNEFGPVQGPVGKGLCQHTGKADECECPLPFREKKMPAFIRKYTSNHCYKFFEVNRDAFFNAEVVKTLLLYGEMETILRICAHPENDLKKWWDVSRCVCDRPDLGWDMICRLAMDAYIMLNVIYCFPDMWDDAGQPVDKYTSLKAYQYVVRRCTKSGWSSEIPTYPHRQFFGIEGGQFRTRPQPADQGRWGYLMEKRIPEMAYYPYGLISYDEFLSFEKQTTYLPHSTDVSHVRWILCQKGLPVELCNSILEEASYIQKRRLPVLDNPFHPKNCVELSQYLKYCWQLVVRCTMMGQALGMNMEYMLDDMVRERMEGLFGCKCFKFSEWEERDDGSSRLVFV